MTAYAARGLISASLILFWFWSSFFTFSHGNADHFQRLGSFGVFSFLMLLAFARGDVDRSESRRIKELERQIEKAKLEQEMDGRVTEDRALQVAWYKEKKIYTLRRRSGLLVMELIGLGCATLQWGYGDLFVKWLHAADA